MTLPPRMKSGRALVAVNEKRTAGLYGSVDEGYRILLPDRTISLGDYADRPYPQCPDGKWFWRRGERPPSDAEPTHKTKRRLRREEENRQIAERTAIPPARGQGAATGVDLSLCVDCGVNVAVLADGHWHDSHPTTTPAGLKPGTVCCPCAERRGYVCAEKVRQRAQAPSRDEIEAEAGQRAIRGLARRRRASRRG